MLSGILVNLLGIGWRFRILAWRYQLSLTDASNFDQREYATLMISQDLIASFEGVSVELILLVSSSSPSLYRTKLIRTTYCAALVALHLTNKRDRYT